jgi:hypothetical protein
VSTLNSTSTRAEVVAAYDDNASYAEDGSVAKCKAFITACRFMLNPGRYLRRASSGGRGGEEFEVGFEQIREEIEAAKRWLACRADVADGGAGVKHLSFERFRS